MQKHNYILSILFMVSILLCTSCEDFLERFPRDAMASETALSDIEGIEATLAGLYNRMQAGTYNHREMNLAGELLADQMDIAQTNAGRMVNHPTNMEGAGFGVWTRLYNDINRLNSILYYIENVDATEARINKAKGESHAMRAYLYFDLLRIYARPYMYQQPLVEGQPLGVIIKTTPFLGVDETTFPERGTIQQGYQLVLDDLTTAEGLLGQDKYPYRFTKIAVKAMLARVNLYMGNWGQALSYANDVISEAPNGLVNATDKDSYLAVFANAPGAESIFELGFTEADRPSMNESVAGMASYFPETGEGYGDVILRQDLLNLLDAYGLEGHPAGQMYYQKIKGGQLCSYQDKYSSYRGERYWDDIKVIRMAEMYFIAAEASAELDELDDAKYYLQELRNNRNIGHLTIDAATKEAFIDLLLTEKRVEFFSEMSHRWFDLRRRGMGIRKGIDGVDAGTPLDFENYRVVERIPESEISSNPNCKQNPGY